MLKDSNILGSCEESLVVVIIKLICPVELAD